MLQKYFQCSRLTLKSFSGICLGALVQASNLYLGLKTGFTFGPQLLGGIGGFLILKPLSRVIPKALPAWCGTGYFGPRENVTCQSAATATVSRHCLNLCAVFPDSLRIIGRIGRPLCLWLARHVSNRPAERQAF